MADQKAGNLTSVTTIASDDYLMAITDSIPENNVVEKISKSNFINDIISTDSGNLLEAGTDDNLKTSSTVTAQGNTFNGNSQLIQTTSSGQYPSLDGSLITGVVTESAVRFGTSSTASATAEKEVTAPGFVLVKGAIIVIDFDNPNTAPEPTLNINSFGAKSILSEDGLPVSATNPLYFPADFKIEFTYDGTNLIFKRRVVYSYVNGASWAKKWSDGWNEQGATNDSSNASTVTYLLPFKDTTYTLIAIITGSSTLAYPTMAQLVNTKNTTNFTRTNTGTSYRLEWKAEGY